jgi:hypothetical protein
MNVFERLISFTDLARSWRYACCSRRLFVLITRRDAAGVHVWTELLICFVYVVDSLKNDKMAYHAVCLKSESVFQ